MNQKQIRTICTQVAQDMTQKMAEIQGAELALKLKK